MRERARSQKIDVPFDADLGDGAPSAWAGDIEQLIFQGSRFVEEVVFFHKASSTLILADLVIAFEPEHVRPHLRWLFALGGMTSPGQTPRDLRATFWGREPRARASYQQMLGWQPRRAIFAHGRFYLDDATAQLERAFAWLR